MFLTFISKMEKRSSTKSRSKVIDTKQYIRTMLCNREKFWGSVLPIHTDKAGFYVILLNIFQ